MSFPTLDVGVVGGCIRILEGIASCVPTLLVGLLIAAILRFYFGSDGVRQLFGGDSLRSLPQAWAVGMLLPVCSIGVLPILIEMRRARVKPGAMSAFALSAPLFNPLSLLYGLTLSRPLVVVMFAFGSLIVVTLVGLVWDRYAGKSSDEEPDAPSSSDEDASTNEPASSASQVSSAGTYEAPEMIGVSRLLAVFVHLTRSLVGPVGGWGLIGLSGLMLLSVVLPFGAMQYSVERDDWSAPATMTAVAIPAYAPPMLAMSQLGMMFQHANSPGAAFVLLVLGAGVNLATILWLAVTFGFRRVTLWFSSLVLIVLSIAYLINQPLAPHGVEPAGHTHAFDIYTNPLHSSEAIRWTSISAMLSKRLDLATQIALGLLAVLSLVGAALRCFAVDETSIASKFASTGNVSEESRQLGRYDRVVSPRLVGGVMLCGLVALSVVMCYGYYPAPNEALEEISIARAECLSAANSGQLEHAAHWLGIWDDWSRRLEVGTFLRTGEVRPYQRMQGYLIRKKLEMLEHELEHDPFEPEETRKVVREIMATDMRWTNSFRVVDP